MEFTKEQQEFIDKMKADITSEFETKIKELEQYKPVEKSDAEKELEKRENELKEKEKNLLLKEAGLTEFASFFDGENLEKQITDFKAIMDSKNTFVPDGHKTTDQYARAEKNKDINGMLSVKLNKIFK